MKVLSSQQIREADQYTIVNEPIKSIDLMERASEAFVIKFLGLHPEMQPVFIFCGTGNNGGDGLAIGRLLKAIGWQIDIFIVGDTSKGSPDFVTNLDRTDSFHLISNESDFPDVSSNSIVIDGLFGSGLTRPVEGLHAKLIEFLNAIEAQRMAIDIASGLYSDEALPEGAIAFKPDYTIAFQVPKLVFFLPECEDYVGTWRVVEIGLDTDFIGTLDSNYYLTKKEYLKHSIPARSTFTHKNRVGRLLIVAGSKGKIGAAVLCTRAAFKAGAGLVNVHVPSCGTEILQISVPEAMVSLDTGESIVENIPKTEDVVAIGPGLGTDPITVDAMKSFLHGCTIPLVVDADGINILAENSDLIKLLPEESILTPHPGEFKKLVGEWKNDFDKLEKLRAFCSRHHLNVVLKGAYSAVCDSRGIIHFNPTGNPGLATAGSGDVLTGVVGALLAQGISPFEALRLAVFLHGAAGDEAVRKQESPWIQASDIIDFFPNSVASLVND